MCIRDSATGLVQLRCLVPMRNLLLLLTDLAQFGLGSPEFFPDLGQLSACVAELALQRGLTLGRNLGVRRPALGRLLARSSDAVLAEVLDVAHVLLQLQYLVLRRFQLHRPNHPNNAR